MENEKENKSEHKTQQKKPEIKYEILPKDYNNKNSLNFKIIVLGDSGVGKSCLLNKAINNMFYENNKATIGFDFFDFNIKIFDTPIKIQIWDTCGQEAYNSLTANIFRNTSLAIIMYEIDSHESFEHIERWLQGIRTFSSPDTKIFLLGNKVDLKDKRKITTEEAETYAKINGFRFFREVSAKEEIQLQKKIFVEAAIVIYKDYLKYNKANIIGENGKLHKRKKIKNKHKTCC